MSERDELQIDADLNAILAETKLRPACEGMSRKETTSLLSSRATAAWMAPARPCRGDDCIPVEAGE